MLITLELTESNTDTVLSYIAGSGLWSRLYIQDPYYRCCLVSCDPAGALWLGLLC